MSRTFRTEDVVERLNCRPSGGLLIVKVQAKGRDRKRVVKVGFGIRASRTGFRSMKVRI